MALLHTNGPDQKLLSQWSRQSQRKNLAIQAVALRLHWSKHLHWHTALSDLLVLLAKKPSALAGL
jgi:hypothetical protein